MPRGSSSSASGLPWVSATIRSRTASSIGPGTTVSSNARASAASSPRSASSGRPASRCPPLGSRTARMSATDSARSRRATNPIACAVASSSHWKSSATQNSGRSSAVADISPSVARATRKRSGGSPGARPNATLRATRWGSGSASSRSSIGAHSWCSPAYGSSISDSTPAIWTTRNPDARSVAWRSNAVLPTPASPRITSTALCPPRTFSSSRSSCACSSDRPCSFGRRSAVIPARA